MDSVKPADIVASMVQQGATKAEFAPFNRLLRGALSGALLGFATSLAFSAMVHRPALGGSLGLPGRLRDDRAARA
jgi:formate transporter